MRSIGILFVFLFLALPLHATSAHMEADRRSLPVDDILTLTLTIVDDEKADVTEVKEPDLPGFDIENRGESTSSSISIVNGKMSSRKERTITYVLRARKAGQFTLGPATLVLEGGREVRSDQIRVTVTGGPSPQTPGTPGAATGSDNGTGEAGSALFGPLSTWEKQTGRYFIRMVVSPEEPHYRGEPLVVAYYLFTQKNLISDLSFYRLPSFDNAWSEELETPRKLTFRRVNIDGAIYDYALIKQYLLIPAADRERVEATQMILDIMTGNFFDARKRTLSSPALSLELAPLPDAATHPGGIVGDLTLAQSHTRLALDKQKPLDTVTYTVSGCGNLQQLDLSLTGNEGIKIFAPDVKTDTHWDGTRLCGVKTFKFMVKGLRAGAYELPAVTLDTYDREKGWQTLTSRPVTVTVAEPAADPAAAGETKRAVVYELLRELPAGITVHDLTPLTGRLSFRLALLVPLVLLAIGILALTARAILRRRREKAGFLLREWERRIESAGDPSTLLNTYYDAIKAITGLSLKGERSREMEKRFGKRVAPFTELARDLQTALYSGGATSDLTARKQRVIELLRSARRLP